MSQERPIIVPADTLKAQRLAGDPAASAWVSANAGSGKTFVLTRRVLRLLLAGVAPEAILCLTYTKAAAAEMRHRVASELARWALAEDADLAKWLEDVTGAPPGADLLRRARTLFAHALETPGGLKINTIHAFCESVLQRFPFEAGVPVDFTVIEEDARAELIRKARESVLAEGLRGHPEVAASVAYLFAQMSDRQIETAIEGALGNTTALDRVLAAPEGAKARAYAFLDVDPDLDDDAVLEEALEAAHVPLDEHEAVFAITPPDPAGEKRFEDKLYSVDRAAPTLDQLFGAYLTQKGAVPANPVKKAIREEDPHLADRLELEAQRLARLCDRRKAVRIARRSAALVDVLSAIATVYERRKRERSLLDFDDLVARTGALFTNAHYGAWVRYKLDAGIEHILVDESQDSNAQQWAVIDALSDDFFHGESAAARPRTLFGVGDPKQSIYSFQGAAPALFAQKGRSYGAQARAVNHPWHDIRLNTSFRTLPGILDGVDAVSQRADVAAGLLDAEVRHESARRDKAGLIEIWPAVPEPEVALPFEAWPLEPMDNTASAARQLARSIARMVRNWIESETPLGQRGRPIVAEDVLILVQSRKALFSEIVKALKDAHIPSPGADRLPVSGHIAVSDLLGLADVLLNPNDDLMLAAILRSPLFALTEAQLYALAQPRPRGDTLWTALSRAAAPEARRAYETLHAWRGRLDLDRPYEFFAHVLYAQGGLKRFHQRLGLEVDEVIAEFMDLALAHEQSDQPSLTGFVAQMRASAITIKRDLAETGAGTRVMTVHGAKGLEAPIVILADATDAPAPVRQSVFFGGEATAPFLLAVSNKDSHCAASLPLLETEQALEDSEYWRKLYVGMTRAEDALYVAGTLPRKASRKPSWHAVVSDALADAAAEVESPFTGQAVLRYPAVQPAPAPLTRRMRPDAAAHAPAHFAPVPPPPSREIVTPSRADGEVAPERALASQAETLLDAESARQKGIALHALLQHLGRVPPGVRHTVAAQAAQTLLPDDAALAASAAEEALALYDDLTLSEIFGPDARPEVSFALDGARNSKPVRLAGRIDRLVVTPRRVLVVDFKSDAVPAAHRAEVPPAYRTQLGLYRKVAQRLFPQMAVEAGILWTATRTLMTLENAILDAATRDYALG